MNREFNSQNRSRVELIDKLRGLAAVLMLLDHSRYFFVHYPFHVLEPTLSTMPIYFTRWITHLAAPLFVFTAGVSVYIKISKSESLSEIRFYLIKRGIIFLMLEFTVVAFLWRFTLNSFMIFQVIGAIATGFIFLSLLVGLPRYINLLISLFILVGHNLLFYIPYYSAPTKDILRKFMFHYSHIQLFDTITLRTAYPVLPWFGIMLLGYVTAPLFFRSTKNLPKPIFFSGVILSVLFVIVRTINGFGNLYPWDHYETVKETLFSFLNCCKYPPSFSFLLLVFSLAAFIVSSGILETRFGKLCEVFGRVPFFFYLTHLLIIHGGAIIAYKLIKGVSIINIYESKGVESFPLAAGWIAFVIVTPILYYLSLWYWNAKRKGLGKRFSF